MNDVVIKHEGDVDVVQYQPQGVCSKLMQIKIKNDIIEEAEIVGGCNGNLTGISSLIKGMNIYEVGKRLKGIMCGMKGTSCPDQLAIALASYIEKRQTINA